MPLADLKLPNDTSFIDDLILQRTEPFTSLGGTPYLGHWHATGEKPQLSAFLRRYDGYLTHYLQEVCTAMEAEADTLIARLGRDRFDRVVSIGPGNGLFETILFRKIGYRDILLIDIEETSGVHRFGFSQEGAAYASLAATKTFMALNGVPETAIHLCNPRREALPTFPTDLLISLLSMGFHYPCDAYADFILTSLTPDGALVFDKRKEADDAAATRLLAALRVTDRTDHEKYERIYATRATGT